MDYSSMSTLLSCPREYEEQYIHRKVGHEESAALAFGTLWHKIMELHGMGYMFTSLVDDAAELVGWTDTGDYRTLARAREAYEQWKERYAKEHWKPLATEQPFSVQIMESCPEPYVGRRDLLVEADSGEGRGVERWIVDYKTTSMLPRDWVTLYRISNQFKLYYAAGRALDPTIAGICVDVVVVSRKETRLYRLFFRYTGEQIEESLVDFAAAVAARDFYNELEYYPRNTKNCRRFGTVCPYLDLCDTHDPELRARLREALPDNTFDPLKTGV